MHIKLHNTYDHKEKNFYSQNKLTDAQATAVIQQN